MITPPPVRPFTDIRLPEAEISTFGSGLKFCRVHGGDADVLRLRIAFRGGEADCRLPQVAQIASLLIPEASKHYPSGTASGTFDFNGAIFGVSVINHHTILTLTSLTSKFDAVAEVLEDIIHNPVYEEKTHEVMRNIVAMRYATSLADVDTRSGLLLNRIMRGPSHPAAVSPTVGDINAITLAEVADFCRRTLRGGSEAVAVLSGNYTDSNLWRAEEMLLNLPCDSVSAITDIPYQPEAPGRYAEQVPGAVQAGVRMGLPAISPFERGYAELSNAVTALGGYFGSRLMSNIREDKGYTYGIQSYILNHREGPSVRISVQTDISTVDAVIEETRHEMRRLAECPPSGDELHRLRQNIALDLASTVDSPFNAAEPYLHSLAALTPEDMFRRRVEALQTLTSEKIARAAARWLDPDALRIAIAADTSAI